MKWFTSKFKVLIFTKSRVDFILNIIYFLIIVLRLKICLENYVTLTVIWRFILRFSFLCVMIRPNSIICWTFVYRPYYTWCDSMTAKWIIVYIFSILRSLNYKLIRYLLDDAVIVAFWEIHPMAMWGRWSCCHCSGLDELLSVLINSFWTIFMCYLFSPLEYWNLFLPILLELSISHTAIT